MIDLKIAVEWMKTEGTPKIERGSIHALPCALSRSRNEYARRRATWSTPLSANSRWTVCQYGSGGSASLSPLRLLRISYEARPFKLAKKIFLDAGATNLD
jgi:hypothetical protein